LEERVREVDRILETVERAPRAYTGEEESYYAYLGDPDQPLLPDEDPSLLRQRISTLYEVVSVETRAAIVQHVTEALSLARLSDLKSAYHRISQRVEVSAIEQLQAELARNHDSVQEIEDTFDAIRRGAVPDRPMYFEWNVWRALSSPVPRKLLACQGRKSCRP
jgi:hypothetical protein